MTGKYELSPRLCCHDLNKLDLAFTQEKCDGTLANFIQIIGAELGSKPELEQLAIGFCNPESEEKVQPIVESRLKYENVKAHALSALKSIGPINHYYVVYEKVKSG